MDSDKVFTPPNGETVVAMHSWRGWIVIATDRGVYLISTDGPLNSNELAEVEIRQLFKL